MNVKEKDRDLSLNLNSLLHGATSWIWRLESLSAERLKRLPIPDCRHYNADYWNICKGEFFSDLSVSIGAATITYGNFIQGSEFSDYGFCCVLHGEGINRFHRKAEKAPRCLQRRPMRKVAHRKFATC